MWNTSWNFHGVFHNGIPWSLHAKFNVFPMEFHKHKTETSILQDRPSLVILKAVFSADGPVFAVAIVR